MVCLWEFSVPRRPRKNIQRILARKSILSAQIKCKWHHLMLKSMSWSIYVLFSLSSGTCSIKSCPEETKSFFRNQTLKCFRLMIVRLKAILLIELVMLVRLYWCDSGVQWYPPHASLKWQMFFQIKFFSLECQIQANHGRPLQRRTGPTRRTIQKQWNWTSCVNAENRGCFWVDCSPFQHISGYGLLGTMFGNPFSHFK